MQNLKKHRVYLTKDGPVFGWISLPRLAFPSSRRDGYGFRSSATPGKNDHSPNNQTLVQYTS
jgi:hypothetical protein